MQASYLARVTAATALMRAKLFPFRLRAQQMHKSKIEGKVQRDGLFQGKLHRIPGYQVGGTIRIELTTRMSIGMHRVPVAS
jgi:hypothetical protein